MTALSASTTDAAADAARYDFGAIRPALRRDLAVQTQPFGGEECVVLEDPVRSRFYRVGPVEYAFLSLLDGRTSVSDAVAATASRFGADAITESQAAGLCRWLFENELASTAQSRSVERLLDAGEQDARRGRRERVNPVMLKLPLGCPDAVVAAASRWLGWLVGWPGAVLLLAAITAAAATLLTELPRMVAFRSVMASDNWIWLALTAAALRIVHELAHGVACRRYGGEVREWGVLLLLFVPLPYVDVTSSWRFGSKWSRCVTAAAGMLAELFVASLAVVAWGATDSPVLQTHLLNVVVSAGVVTLLFNVNPLMRFDGYFILSDVLELPNLATHGRQVVSVALRRVFLAERVEWPRWPEGRGGLVAIYGVAAAAWRVLICVSLTLAAETLYHGLGIVLAAASLTLWAVLPAGRFVVSVVRPDPVRPINRGRLLLTTSAFAAVAFVTLTQLTWTRTLRLPAIVEYPTVHDVRSAADGFVRAVLVRPGQEVRAGDPVALLVNEDLLARVRGLELAVAESQLRMTGFHRRRELAAAQIEAERRESLAFQLSQLRRQVQELTVTTPVAGRVLSPEVDSLVGRWVTRGGAVVEVGPAGERAVRFYVPQEEIDAVRRHAEQPVYVRVWGDESGSFEGPILGVAPRATTRLDSPRLTAVAGGPLAVAAADADDAAADGQWRLTQPYFVGRVATPAGRRLGTGQTASVELLTRSRTLGRTLAEAARGYFHRRQSLR